MRYEGLEPEAEKLIPGLETLGSVVMLSQAVSLKRIADGLEALQRIGERIADSAEAVAKAQKTAERINLGRALKDD